MPTREARKSTRELDGFPELLTAQQARSCWTFRRQRSIAGVRCATMANM
jgi:hypothetical protein